MKNSKRSSLKTINIACGYSALYAGNFIPSILSVAGKLKSDYRVILSFPKTAKKRSWIGTVQSKFDTYFFDNDKKHSRRRDLKKINRNNRVSILYTNFFSVFFVQTLYLFKRMQLIIHVLSDFSKGRKMPLSFRLKIFFAERLLHRKTTFIYCSKTAFQKSKAKNKFFVPSGLSTERIVSKKNDLVTLRKQHKIVDGDYLFLLFGWSPIIKGIDIAVKALNNCIKKGNKNFKIMVVYGKDNGKENLIRLIKDIGCEHLLSTNIILVEPNDDVFSYYSVVNCFISASRSEGFPYSVLEALYAKKMVIVSSIPATKWALEYRTVFEFESENVDDLSSRMIECYKSHIETNVFDDVSIKIYAEYNIDKWSDDVIEIFEEQIV